METIVNVTNVDERVHMETEDAVTKTTVNTSISEATVVERETTGNEAVVTTGETYIREAVPMEIDTAVIKRLMWKQKLLSTLMYSMKLF